MYRFRFAILLTIALHGASCAIAQTGQFKLVEQTGAERQPPPNKPRQSPSVYVLGAVMQPGLYTLENICQMGNNHSRQADHLKPTLSAALEAAGGILETADISRIRLTKLHPPITTGVNLWGLMLSCDKTQDLQLTSGDVIFVPTANKDVEVRKFGTKIENSQRVRIMGAVLKPGLFDITTDDDLRSVLAKAGGIAATASPRHILISRLNRDGTVGTTTVNLIRITKHREKLPKVKPGDIILVRNSEPSETKMTNSPLHSKKLIGDFWSGLNLPHEP